MEPEQLPIKYVLQVYHEDEEFFNIESSQPFPRFEKGDQFYAPRFDSSYDTGDKAAVESVSYDISRSNGGIVIETTISIAQDHSHE